jgi:hypothetical protein
MKKLLTLALLILCTGCVWNPHTLYTETSTYDNGVSAYQEVGVSGSISGKVDMDLFGVANLNLHGERGHLYGGGFRFSVDISGGK